MASTHNTNIGNVIINTNHISTNRLYNEWMRDGGRKAAEMFASCPELANEFRTTAEHHQRLIERNERLGI